MTEICDKLRDFRLKMCTPKGKVCTPKGKVCDSLLLNYDSRVQFFSLNFFSAKKMRTGHLAGSHYLMESWVILSEDLRRYFFG